VDRILNDALEEDDGAASIEDIIGDDDEGYE
jgi:hypothetical protein